MNFQFIKNYIDNILQNSLVRNTLFMLFSNGFKLFVQAGYFVLIARTLGSQQYGIFIGIISLANLLNPFVTWGTGDILIKKVSRNRSVFSQYWGNNLFITIVFGLSLILLVLLVGERILPPDLSPVVVILLLLSELILTVVIDAAAKAFLSVDLLNITGQMNILLSLKSLVAVIILVVFFKEPNLMIWAILYSSSSLAAALFAVLLVNRLVGAPKLYLPWFKQEFVQGFYFSITLSAENINHNVDKTMISRLSTPQATGIYGAAYRLVDVSFVPVASLMSATYMKFFQKGVTGISGILNFAKRLSLMAGGYGIIAGLGLFFFAPIVPYILGKDYAESVNALRWLAAIPFLQALQYFAADTLTGAGFQGLRSAVQVTMALLNFMLNLWLIPIYSWRGAAWSSLASDGLKMFCLWILVFYLYRQEIQRREG
ncbi:MAG: oligosaccharide flippase family protein [Moorea sp. SIO2B7]|nr:oligosaccharide flippase family protein [Moorena sp. SIO2B7]